MIVTLILFLVMAWMSHHSQITQRNSCKAHDNRKALCFDMCACSLTQCVGLCGPMDCSLPGFSVYGILQARILEWVAIPFSRGSSRPRDWTHVSWVSSIGRQILYHWVTWEALRHSYLLILSLWHYKFNNILFWYFSLKGNSMKEK